MFRWFLIILVYTLRIIDFHVCEYYYKNDGLNWGILRAKYISAEFLIFGLLLLIGLKNRYQFISVFSLFIFFIGDFTDRIFFDITTFEENDKYFIISNVIITTIGFFIVYDNSRKLHTRS